MKTIWTHFSAFSFFTQLVLVLCVLGVLVNGLLIARDLSSNGILLRLHVGFLILYIFQIVFIFLYEKYVCILTLLQGVLALLTNADFIFVPLLRVIGSLYYATGTPSVEGLKVYKYVFVSMAFTLQMLTAYILFVELKFFQAHTQKALSGLNVQAPVTGK